MSSRRLTWHDIDECTYRFGSLPNEDIENPSDRRPDMKTVSMAKSALKTKKKLATKTKPTRKTKPTTKTKPMMKMKPATPTTKAMQPSPSESEYDDGRMLRMLHDSIFCAPSSYDVNQLIANDSLRKSTAADRPPHH